MAQRAEAPPETEDTEKIEDQCIITDMGMAQLGMAEGPPQNNCRSRYWDQNNCRSPYWDLFTFTGAEGVQSSGVHAGKPYRMFQCIRCRRAPLKSIAGSPGVFAQHFRTHHYDGPR